MNTKQMLCDNKKKLEVTKFDKANQSVEDTISVSEKEINKNFQELRTIYPTNFFGAGRMCEK